MPVRRHPLAMQAHNSPLANIPLDTALAARLRETYHLVRSRGLLLAERFYAKLFAAAPSLRPMFRGDITSQAAKLMASLDAVVRCFETPGHASAMLTDLGRRHAGYGARPEHYAVVCTLLIECMRELLDAPADDHRLIEWHEAISLISAHMTRAGSERV